MVVMSDPLAALSVLMKVKAHISVILYWKTMRNDNQ